MVAGRGKGRPAGLCVEMGEIQGAVWQKRGGLSAGVQLIVKSWTDREVRPVRVTLDGVDAAGEVGGALHARGRDTVERCIDRLADLCLPVPAGILRGVDRACGGSEMRMGGRRLKGRGTGSGERWLPWVCNSVVEVCRIYLGASDVETLVGS